MVSFRPLALLAVAASSAHAAQFSVSLTGNKLFNRSRGNGGADAERLTATAAAAASPKGPGALRPKASAGGQAKTLVKGAKDAKADNDRLFEHWTTWTSKTDGVDCAVSRKTFEDMAPCRTEIDFAKERHMAQVVAGSLPTNLVQSCPYGYLVPNVVRDVTHNGYFTDYAPVFELKYEAPSCKSLTFYAVPETKCTEELGAKKVWLGKLEADTEQNTLFVPIDRVSVAVIIDDCQDMTLRGIDTLPIFAKGNRKIPEGLEYSESGVFSTLSLSSVALSTAALAAIALNF